jgi:hypothetical protein
LLLRSEDLDRRPDETLARICRFLGVASPAAPVTPRRELVSRELDYGAPISDADRAHLSALYAEDLARFAELSGLDVGGWMDAPSSPRPGWAKKLRRLLRGPEACRGARGVSGTGSLIPSPRGRPRH